MSFHIKLVNQRLCNGLKSHHLEAGVCSVERKSCSARKRKSVSQRKTWDQ